MKITRWLALFFGAAGCIVHLSAQQDDLKVREFVSVFNMMILVRVQDNGRPVSGLKKEDFILSENRHRLEINGFREVRRSIAARQVELATQVQETRAPRFFLLYFWLANSNVEYKKTIGYFFENVYHEGDRVVLASQHNGIMITRKDEIDEKIAAFSNSLDGWIQTNESEYKALLNRLEQKVERFKDQLQKPPTFRPRNFKEDFRFELESSWKEFKYSHLRSNFGQALRLAEVLKTINEEKWVLVFYQPLQYPMLRIDHNLLPITKGDALDVQAFLDKLIDDMIMDRISDSNFPQIRDVQQAFIAANATFHVLQPPAADVKRFHSDSLQEIPVYSNWEDTFKRISKATGGMVAAGGELREILDRVIEKEDVYYELSYAPGEAEGKKRSIKVTMAEGNYTVFNVHKTEVREMDLVKLDQMTFSQPFLKFRVSDFQRIYEADKMQGHLTITITATSAIDDKIQFTKDLAIAAAESVISLKLNFPQPGKYRIEAKVIDALTDRQAVASREIDVLAQ